MKTKSTFGIFNVFLLLLLVLSFAQSDLAQDNVESKKPQADATRGTKIIEIPLKDEDGKDVKFLYKESHALLIGASEYRAGWNRLAGVPQDIEAVKTLLEGAGFQVQTLLDPTSVTLEPAIKDFLASHGLDKDNRLIIYYAGHGDTLTYHDGTEQGFILPVDTPQSAQDSTGFIRKAVPIRQFELYAQVTAARHVMFVFDSCFSGFIFERSGGDKISKFISAQAAAPTRLFITSGTSKQRVPDLSIFRLKLVEALNGAADRNDDGYVTGTELATYLQSEVTNLAPKHSPQTPQWGIKDPALNKGDIIFVVPKGAKPRVRSSGVECPTDATLISQINIPSDQPRLIISTEQTVRIETASFSPDQRYIATAQGNQVDLWNAIAGRVDKKFTHGGEITCLMFSPDSRFVVTGGRDKVAELWNTGDGQRIRSFLGHAGAVLTVAFSPDSRTVITGSDDKTAKLWNTESGKSTLTINGHSAVLSVTFSPDGKKVLIGHGDGVANLWDLTTGRELQRFKGHSDAVRAVAFSPDGQVVLTGGDDGTARIWDATKGTLIRYLVVPGAGVKAVSFSPDGRLILTSSKGSPAHLWDASTGLLVRRLDSSSFSSNLAVFSPSGQLVLLTNYEGIVTLIRVADGQLLCQLISFRDGAWTVFDPVNRVDTSPSARKLIHWMVGSEQISFEQLMERYYEPGLLGKVLGVTKEPLRDVSLFKPLKLYPKVDVELPAASSTELTITLINQGGGIGKVSVLINGREVIADARPAKFDPASAKARLIVDIGSAPLISGAQNKINVKASNAEGYLSGPPIELLWNPSIGAPPTPPEFYAIVAGTSEYTSPNLRMAFPAKDAESMARALQVGANKLFGQDKVHVTLLKNPTKQTLRTAFEQVRRAKPSDVFLLYLAGLGVVVRGSGYDIYAYLTTEAVSADQTVLSDPMIRQQISVTSDELVEWIKQIPALKQALILDTCAASAAVNSLVVKQTLPSDQIRAIDRLKDRTGLIVLMGSAADAVSYEASAYGGSLLTHAVLEGMKGAALRDGAFVDVHQLFDYAADRVPQLARNIGGIQRPLILAPESVSFDIGLITTDNQQAIPLASLKTLVLRPLFINIDDGFDNLKLTQIIAQRLRDMTAKTFDDSPFVYVEAEELSGAIRPIGTYVVEGEQIKVRVRLLKDAKAIDTLTIDGSKNEISAMADKIVARIVEVLRGMP